MASRLLRLIDLVKKDQDRLRGEMARVQADLSELGTMLSDSAQHENAMADQTGTSPVLLMQFPVFHAVEEAKRIRIRQAIQGAHKIEERLRADLIACHQRIRSLEALIERERQATLRRLARRERTELEEHALRTWREGNAT